MVEDKWLTALEAGVLSELERVPQALIGQVRAPTERYERSLPALEAWVEACEARVRRHLERMGFSL